MPRNKRTDKPPREQRDRDDTFTGSFHERWVASTKPRNKEVQYAERLKKGLSLMLYVSALPHGTKTWRVLYYENGKPRSKRLGTYPDLTVAKARVKADEFDKEVAIASTQAGTFKGVAEQWIVEHVVKRGLISKRQIVQHLTVYVYPKWETRPIFEITRLDVNNLLRDIEKKHGAPTADRVLMTIRGIMTWYAVQDHRYALPIVPKMQRDKRTAQEKARARSLSDDELRAVWKACDELDVYGSIVRVLLLTAQRKEKVSMMRWSDLDNGVWTIRAHHRGKGTAVRVRLPQAARDIITSQPRIADNPHVFPGGARGRRRKSPDHVLPSTPPAFNSFSQRKRELDKLLPKDMPHWTLHDLRRTGRSLMTRIGIPREIAELTLGHRQQGVLAVYDRHDYFEEKSDALKRLADHIALLLNPAHGDNVVKMQPRAG